jgi:hypothetical protein
MVATRDCRRQAGDGESNGHSRKACSMRALSGVLPIRSGRAGLLLQPLLSGSFRVEGGFRPDTGVPIVAASGRVEAHATGPLLEDRPEVTGAGRCWLPGRSVWASCERKACALGRGTGFGGECTDLCGQAALAGEIATNSGGRERVFVPASLAVGCQEKYGTTRTSQREAAMVGRGHAAPSVGALLPISRRPASGRIRRAASLRCCGRSRRTRPCRRGRLAPGRG